MKTINSGSNPRRTAANAAYAAAISKRSKHGSKLERRFSLVWKSLKGPELVREHRFCEGRRWRFDFAHLGTKVAIELEGGIWTNGAHNRGQHFISDCEKYNEAGFLGWTVFRLATGMVRADRVWEIVDHIGRLQCAGSLRTTFRPP